MILPSPPHKKHISVKSRQILTYLLTFLKLLLFFLKGSKRGSKQKVFRSTDGDTLNVPTILSFQDVPLLPMPQSGWLSCRTSNQSQHRVLSRGRETPSSQHTSYASESPTAFPARLCVAYVLHTPVSQPSHLPVSAVSTPLRAYHTSHMAYLSCQ